ncbi:MAG: DUF1080 domain-containing protein [Planctomycetaceae bacterium]|nr:DUF1080 domain-containing protein [Planctomycetaceae bacterium]
MNSIAKKMMASCQLLIALAILASTVTAGEKGFISLMAKDGKSGWEKTVNTTADGYLDGDGCYMDRKFGDFVMKFEFRLKEGSNSGIGIRSEQGQNAAFNGMELQVLDNSAAKYATLKEWQYHGSIYGVAAAKRGALKKVGEWNVQEIVAKGDHIKITLNGQVIIDTHLKEAAPEGKTIDGRPHKRLFAEDGYIRLCGHGGGVEFRAMRIKPLDK